MAIESIRNPLVRGFYSIPEAARLIEVGNTRRIHGWLRGYPKRSKGPLIRRDYEPIEDCEELSFLDLLEIRFIEYFREQGVRVQTLRRAVETARDIWKTEKPFSTSRIKFTARKDGKDVIAEQVLKPTAESEHDPKLLSLCTRQYEIYAAIREILIKGLSFDPHTHLAVSWKPRADRFPEVVINPTIAYGRPFVPSKVPTATLFEAWKAEGQQFEPVADWYEVPIAETKMAVEFEQELIHDRAIAA
jgi:uncharacterized protein (DUF433 family)